MSLKVYSSPSLDLITFRQKGYKLAQEPGLLFSADESQ